MSLRDIINFILDVDLNLVTYFIIAIMIGYVIYIFLGIFFEVLRMQWKNIKKGFKIILIIFVIYFVFCLINYYFGFFNFYD